MQVALCPGLWTANENVTALSFRKCSGTWRKEKKEVKLTECKWLAGVGMEMKWMADEVFLLPSQKHSGRSDPNCEKRGCQSLRVKPCLISLLPSFFFCPPFSLNLFSLLCPSIFSPPHHHWDGFSKSNHKKKKKIIISFKTQRGVSCIRGVTVATRW